MQHLFFGPLPDGSVEGLIVWEDLEEVVSVVIGIKLDQAGSLDRFQMLIFDLGAVKLLPRQVVDPGLFHRLVPRMHRDQVRLASSCKSAGRWTIHSPFLLLGAKQLTSKSRYSVPQYSAERTTFKIVLQDLHVRKEKVCAQPQARK